MRLLHNQHALKCLTYVDRTPQRPSSTRNKDSHRTHTSLHTSEPHLHGALGGGKRGAADPPHLAPHGTIPPRTAAAEALMVLLPPVTRGGRRRRLRRSGSRISHISRLSPVGPRSRSGSVIHPFSQSVEAPYPSAAVACEVGHVPRGEGPLEGVREGPAAPSRGGIGAGGRVGLRAEQDQASALRGSKKGNCRVGCERVFVWTFVWARAYAGQRGQDQRFGVNKSHTV